MVVADKYRRYREQALPFAKHYSLKSLNRVATAVRQQYVEDNVEDE